MDMSNKTIKAARESLRIGQKNVAEYVGVPQSTISKIETGTINPGNITAKNIVALSEVLEVPVEYLIREGSAKISLDNGRSWSTPEEAIDSVPWDILVSAMDDRFREWIHRELAPCEDLQFLTEYLEIAPQNLILG